MAFQNNTPPSKAPWLFGRKVWQWCSTRGALLSVLLPVVVALIASLLLPQAPAYLRADAFAYQEWLAERQVQFKIWTPLLTTIGAFYIRQTLWFRVLVSALAFVLLVALGEQVRTLLNPAATRQTTHIHADRRTWAKAGLALGYLGLLLLTIGLAVQTRWGWRQSDINVLPYTDIDLGPDRALKLQLLDLQTTAQAGQPVPEASLQIAGHMTLPIRLGVPVRHRGYRYLWVSQGGPSVRLQAWRVSDPERPLTLYDYAVRPQPASSLQFNFVPGQESDRLFILSEDKVVGSLFWDDEQAASADRPAFYLWVFGEDGQRLGAQPFEPIESESDTLTQQATVKDVVYRLEIARYIVLDIAYRPGLWVLWLGGALLVLACLSFLVSVRQNRKSS